MAKRMARSQTQEQSTRGEYIDKVVKIKRCAAVVKGGRRFSFSAMVVVGDGEGRVGWGYGKANEVPPSVEKAVKQATRSMVNVSIVEGSIPHIVNGRFGAAKVLLAPAGPGTGGRRHGPRRAIAKNLQAMRAEPRYPGHG